MDVRDVYCVSAREDSWTVVYKRFRKSSIAKVGITSWPGFQEAHRPRLESRAAILSLRSRGPQTVGTLRQWDSPKDTNLSAEALAASHMVICDDHWVFL